MINTHPLDWRSIQWCFLWIYHLSRINLYPDSIGTYKHTPATHKHILINDDEELDERRHWKVSSEFLQVISLWLCDFYRDRWPDERKEGRHSWQPGLIERWCGKSFSRMMIIIWTSIERWEIIATYNILIIMGWIIILNIRIVITRTRRQGCCAVERLECLDFKALTYTHFLLLPLGGLTECPHSNLIINYIISDLLFLLNMISIKMWRATNSFDDLYTQTSKYAYHWLVGEFYDLFHTTIVLELES